jgi:hypothetical protein
MARLRSVVAAAVAAVLGAAPHVLHHAGPLAGAALLAGVTGKLLFALAGFALAVPMLRRVRRHTGSWRAPAGLLSLMAVAFTLSSFVVGPALTGSETERPPAESTPGEADPEHDEHHP